ncbi:hypothetical protein HK100_012851, partial [Physocladia obscura]
MPTPGGAIRGYGFSFERGHPTPANLAAGWGIFISRLCEWLGTGAPHDIQFTAVKSFAFVILQIGLNDYDYDFGNARLDLQASLIMDKLNIYATINNGSSQSGNGAGSDKASSCFKWNSGLPCA